VLVSIQALILVILDLLVLNGVLISAPELIVLPAVA